MKQRLTILLAIVALVAAFYWTATRRPPAEEQQVESVAAATARLGKPAPAAPESITGTTPDARETTTRPEVDLEKVQEDIQEATIQYSESELPKFERWLKSPNAEIRTAAADGLVQSGVAAGAVLLRDAAAASKNPEEAAALLERASILELPPATEQLIKALQDERKDQPPAEAPPVPAEEQTGE